MSSRDTKLNEIHACRHVVSSCRYCKYVLILMLIIFSPAKYTNTYLQDPHHTDIIPTQIRRKYQHDFTVAMLHVFASIYIYL